MKKNYIINIILILMLVSVGIVNYPASAQGRFRGVVKLVEKFVAPVGTRYIQKELRNDTIDSKKNRGHNKLGRGPWLIIPVFYGSNRGKNCLGGDSWMVSPNLDINSISVFKQQNDVCRFGDGVSSFYFLSKNSFSDKLLLDGSNLNYMYVKNGHLHWKGNFFTGVSSFPIKGGQSLFQININEFGDEVKYKKF